MRISASQLRRLIREEVASLRKRRALREASSGSPPSDFRAYRTAFGRALREAGAPEKMVKNVLDLDREGGTYFDPLWQAWEQWEAEDDEDKTQEGWEQHVRYYVNDAVVDMFSIAGAESDEDFERAKSVARAVATSLKNI